MTGLDVIQCGPGVSVQDAGRFGHRRYGVTTAGAMDRQALALANALVGNDESAGAVEIPLTGARFKVVGGPVLVSVAGANATLSVAGRPVAPKMSVRAHSGEEIVVGAPRGGVYGYLAVAGGVLSPPDLGSRSCHHRSGVGGRVLTPGDRLECRIAGADQPLILDRDPGPDSSGDICVMPGPQAACFDAATWALFLSSTYRISQNSDRMGLWLEGPRLHAEQGHDIVSEGVIAGSIQVPGNGAPVILGRDCQTTGGYPKIATVISADLDRLAQLPFGSGVRFREVSRDEAVIAARRAARWRRDIRNAVRPVGALTPDLLSLNLIGGVTRGDDL